MKMVVRINHPRQLNEALASDQKIIRIGEEHCFDCARDIWPPKVVAQSFETIKANNRAAEFAWLVSLTSSEQEEYLTSVAEIVAEYREVAQPLISDWGSLRKYRDLNPVGGERLFIYHYLSLALLKDLGVKEFYLPFDLTKVEIAQLAQKAQNEGLAAGVNLLPPVLLVSWRELSKESSHESHHHQLLTYHAGAVSLFTVEGKTASSPNKPLDFTESNWHFGRVLTAEIS